MQIISLKYFTGLVLTKVVKLTKVHCTLVFARKLSGRDTLIEIKVHPVILYLNPKSTTFPLIPIV